MNKRICFILIFLLKSPNTLDCGAIGQGFNQQTNRRKTRGDSGPKMFCRAANKPKQHVKPEDVNLRSEF